MNSFLLGKVLHEILMDGNYSGLKSLDKETRSAVEITVITVSMKHNVLIEPGQLVMDIRPFNYGKLYTIKSIKTVKFKDGLMDVAVMNQNGVTLRMDQFQLRVN